MPVYQFICKKHGGFEKITIRAEWDDIRCPKCAAKSKVDQKFKSAHNCWVDNIQNNRPTPAVVANAFRLADCPRK